MIVDLVAWAALAAVLVVPAIAVGSYVGTRLALKRYFGPAPPRDLPMDPDESSGPGER